MQPLYRRSLIVLTLTAALPVAAQTAGTTATTTAATTTTTATTGTTGRSVAGDRLVSDFTAFSGSKENAASLVSGLRTGGAITLIPSGSTAAPAATGTVSFTPPTRPMGHGNVRIALSLARAQLAGQGITRPTPEQLQTALVGSPAAAPAAGTTATGTTGILQMRADGMGWGKIANSMGFKLGAVMSGRATAAAAASGTTTAAGSAAGASAGRGKGSGIVTAGGGGSYSSGLGRGRQAGPAASGVVSAQGAAHGQGMVAGGQGKGGGKH